MHILLTGLNHKTAPLDLRERVSFTREQLPDALPALADRAGEGVIISTCNRTEVYTVNEEPIEGAAGIHDFIADYHGLDHKTLSPSLYDRTGAEAVAHLFRVASGLDSMVLGESEILGQVRGALTAASVSHSLSSPMSRLFHRAIRTGRRVREETALGRNSLSASYAAVHLAQRVLGDLDGRRVLLIGAGEAGQLVARALSTTGASELTVANRTFERSEALANSLGGKAITLEEAVPSLVNTDILIAATEAPGYVLTRDDIDRASDSRNGQPLFLFDLSVPRNIDPDVAAAGGVKLFNIDDLSSIAEENLHGREEAAADAEVIVEEETALFMELWDSLEAVPLIKELREQAERTRQRELARAVRKLPDLSSEDLETLDALTRSIINRLLHGPTVSLKQHSDEAHLRAARELFRLWEERR